MPRLQEIEQRKAEIRSLLEGADPVDLDGLEKELRELNEEKSQIEKRYAMAKGIDAGFVPVQIIPQENEKRGVHSMEVIDIRDTAEYRSAFLKNLQGKELNDVEKRALSTAANSAGAAVPTQTFNSIIDKLRQTSVLFTRISVSFIPGNISFVVANAKNAAAWKVQNNAGTAADDTVVNVNLSGFELIKLVEISAAAQAMTIDAFEAYIVAEIGRQMAIALENAILNGTGSGQPTGILSGVTFNASNSLTWAANASVAYDNLVDGLALLPTMYHPTAVFVMNRKTLFSGIRKIKATDGQPIFTYNPQDAARAAILGYEVIVDDYIADDTILLGDLNYYRMNFSLNPTIESSRDAGFNNAKTTFRGLAVVDGKPVLDEAFVKISKATS